MNDSDRALVDRIVKTLRVKPGTKVQLPSREFDPGHTAHFVDEKSAAADLARAVTLLAEYQERLAAQSTYALLVVIQGMDASGKDGAVKHVMSGVNPSGVHVHSFKVPSTDELAHDVLWRYEANLPRRGEIGIFNRSHYEEVLVVRVHPDLLVREGLPPESVGKGIWARRFREINNWEQYLVDNGVHIVKLFLNLSKEEQRKRFLQRIDEPRKNWKFSAADVEERHHWDAYMDAYSQMLTSTNTDAAPWFAVPADHKWFTRLAVAAAVVQALMRIDPQFPAATEEQRRALQAARAALLAEG
jgi:PPK2 family polyphosphate:nucleotide phosphotransferase